MNYIEKHYAESATHHYIFGVEHNGRVTAHLVHLDLDGFRFIFCDKPTTAHRCTVVKYRSNKRKREWFEANAIQSIDLCTIDELKSSCRVRLNRFGKEYIENCGECFEWLMAQHFGVEQNEKANLKFTDGGDLTINGVPYQVKYERAGITVVL